MRTTLLIALTLAAFATALAAEPAKPIGLSVSCETWDIEQCLLDRRHDCSLKARAARKDGRMCHPTEKATKP